MREPKFMDDSSSALGLSHGEHGERYDRGREIVDLGKPDKPGYRKDLDGLTPDEIIARIDNSEERGAAQLRPGYTIIRGKSSAGKKRKSEKAGTWICTECNLELCGHRPRDRGRPSKEPTTRDAIQSVRMTPETLGLVRQLKISAGDALALFAVAYDEGRSLDSVIQEWRHKQ